MSTLTPPAGAVVVYRPREAARSDTHRDSEAQALRAAFPNHAIVIIDPRAELYSETLDRFVHRALRAHLACDSIDPRERMRAALKAALWGEERPSG